MVIKKKITVSWSGGKDSALALYRILQSVEYEVKHLHTVIDKTTRRVGLHGVSEALIERQAEALGLKLIKLYLPTSQDHESYTNLMTNFYRQCASEEIYGVLFGDIFLEDLKSYRDNMLQQAGLFGIYPLWKQNSEDLITEFLDAGFKTLICSADKKYFNTSHIGKVIDKQFIQTLSPSVDVCGENGEFHTFVFEGPIFNHPVLHKTGNVVEKSYNYKVTGEQGAVEMMTSSFLFQDLDL